jgi:hypothetical protein
VLYLLSLTGNGIRGTCVKIWPENASIVHSSIKLLNDLSVGCVITVMLNLLWH